jgi:hypothetical protein
MTKKVRKIINGWKKDGIIDQLHEILVKMKNDGEIDTDSEIPEHFGNIAEKLGFEHPRDMGGDKLQAFMCAVDNELEKVFGLKVEAGYFVTEAFKPISRKKFESILESTINEIYKNRYLFDESDDDDERLDSQDYVKTYNRKYTHTDKEKPFVEKNEPRAIVIWSDDRSERITAYLHANHLSGANQAYNGSVWTLRVYKDGKNINTKNYRSKVVILKEIYALPNFSKATEELNK